MSESPVLAGRRIAVVGASSGIGRSLAAGLGAKGARVGLLARRADRLRDAAVEAGPGAIAVPCDVRDEGAVRAAIDTVVDGLGGLDGLVYSAGVGHLSRLADTDADTWRWILDVNVVGAASFTRAALPHLEASRGVAVYLSSSAGSVTGPWPGLGAYGASKAALESSVEGWRQEHPAVAFTRIVVGDTAGGDGDAATGFADAWDPELAGELFPEWLRRGLMDGSLMAMEDLVDAVTLVLASGAAVRSMTITGRLPD
jgi:NAD(P)-dependent dehydrogenase (short-subunit alcohol dehydrogenase family)